MQDLQALHHNRAESGGTVLAIISETHLQNDACRLVSGGHRFEVYFIFSVTNFQQSVTLPMPFMSSEHCTPRARNARIIELRVMLFPLSILHTCDLNQMGRFD